MGISIETIKASQLAELTEVTDSNYVVVTDGYTSKKVKATNLKGNSLTSTQEQQLSDAYAHSQTAHVQSSDIPTKTSELTNDSGFITSIPSGYVTDTNLSTELDQKVNKEVGKGLSTNDLTNELVTIINSSATEAFVTNAIANAQLGD